MKNKLILFLGLRLALTSALAQPVITNQPQNQTAIAGATVTFSVEATGTPPLTYQWRRYTNTIRFTELAGETNSTLVLTNIQPNSLKFAAIVTDGSSLSVTSSLARLTVFGFSQQPSNQSVSLGAKVQFSVKVENSHPPIRYQWQLAGTNLVNRTNATLNLTNVTLLDRGDYNVLATDTIGSVTSRVARLEIDPTFIKITTGSVVNDGGYSFACAWGDYDDDGFTDLFVCNNWPRDVGGAQHDFLYRNNGNGTFTRIMNGPLVNEDRWAVAASWGDYDNDGRVDLFVTRPSLDSNGGLGPNTLYHNEGNGLFTKVTVGLLVTQPLHSHSGVWADIDNDGLIDLFVGNFRTALTSAANDNYLYRNRGGGTFERSSFGSKTLTNSDSWGVALADFNNDGWIDLVVPQGGTAGSENNLLYENDHYGQFRLLTNNVVFSDGGNSIACAWGDYDNDGLLDLFVSNFYNQNNFLYHNDGNGAFTKITNSPVTLDGGSSTGCAWGDYDNDGWLDLFVSNLGPINYVDPDNLTSIAPENNFLYHNNGDGTFRKITTGSVVNDLGYSTGCAWADYDNDGFLDLFVANGWITVSENNFLYRNSGNTNNWISFRLIGTVSNRSAIGAKIRVRATINGRSYWQMREIGGGGSYGSQNDMRAHFGLGNATNLDTVRIEWPSGTVQELHNLASKQILTVSEPPKLLVDQAGPVSTFSIRGGRGLRYEIDSSSNLIDWATIGILTLTNQLGVAPIVDPNAFPTGRRFYRAISH